MKKRNKIRTIAFCGSPRKKGNTELLLNETIRGVEDAGAPVQVFNLNSMKIKPCQDCSGCNETGTCIFRDEMDLIYDAIRTADRIILASPIFFFALSAQAKIMVDRCQSFWAEKYLLKRPLQGGGFNRKGLLLLVGGMEKDIGVQCAEASARAFFRTISIPEHEMLYYIGIDAKGDILRHRTALKDAYKAGKKLAKEG